MGKLLVGKAVLVLPRIVRKIAGDVMEAVLGVGLLDVDLHPAIGKGL